MSNNKPKLEEYFLQARKETPVMSIDEMRNLVDKKAVSSASDTTLNIKQTKGVKPMQLITAALGTAAVVSIITISSLDFGNKETQAEYKEQAAKAQITQVNP